MGGLSRGGSVKDGPVPIELRRPAARWRVGGSGSGSGSGCCSCGCGSTSGANRSRHHGPTTDDEICRRCLPVSTPLLLAQVGGCDFDADQDGDLGFKTGDRIVVTAKEGDWWEGYLESDPSKTGQFPSNYVDPLPDGEAAAAPAAAPVPAAASGEALSIDDVSPSDTQPAASPPLRTLPPSCLC